MTSASPSTPARSPTVSFVVPCYKLAHLLPECVRSILSQTYGELEVLIMDDCSPDDTAEVARSFRDPRVIHVRNDPNLGQLRNFNEGIRRARGKYVWLISADDYLRRPYVLERYVELLERRPRVGYAFCSGVSVREGVETGVVDWAHSAGRDRVIPGRVWLKTLLRRNVVLAPSVLVRRDCYEALGAFPLDLPWSGDWYLWCLFALHRDVAYFAEPMVCYREHALSMTTHFTQERADVCCREELSIRWRIKRSADVAGLRGASRDCLRAAAEAHAKSIATRRYGMSRPFMSLDEFERYLGGCAATERERRWVRAHVYAEMGNELFWHGDVASARQYYGRALRMRPWMARVLAKRALLSLGGFGTLVRTFIRALRSRPGSPRVAPGEEATR